MSLYLIFCINNDVPDATSIAKSDVYKGRPIEDGEKLHDAKVLRRPWGCNSWSLLFRSLVTCYATRWFWFKSWIPKKNIFLYVLRFHVVRGGKTLMTLKLNVGTFFGIPEEPCNQQSQALSTGPLPGQSDEKYSTFIFNDPTLQLGAPRDPIWTDAFWTFHLWKEQIT